MALYMDVHRSVAGATADAVAQAHERDLAIEGQYDVSYEKYWLDESTGTIFCLVKAPSKQAAERVHREAHGLVADEIYEVKEAK